MSNTSIGHKTVTVRRQTPAPSGHGLQASLKRLSSELTEPEVLLDPQITYTPDAPVQTCPEPAAEPSQSCAAYTTEAQSNNVAEDTPELHYYTGPFYYYVRCRSDGPIWTPEPSYANKRGIALYTSVYIESAAVPSFLYVRCGADSPIWVPVSP